MPHVLFRSRDRERPRFLLPLALLPFALLGWLSLMLVWTASAAPAAAPQVVLPQVVPPQVGLRAGHDARVSRVLFSTDGKTLASLGMDGAVNLWDARTGVRRAHWQPVGTHPNQIAFSPDGARLAVGATAGTVGQTTGVIVLLDGRTGASVRTLTVTTGFQSDLNTFAWSPDGRTLAVARRSAPAALWDAATAAVRTTLPAETTGASGIDFSPDGGLVVTRFDSPPQRQPATPPVARPRLAWDARTGAAAALAAPPALPADLAALPTLASGPEGRLVLGDLERQDVEFRGRIMPGQRVLSTTPVFWDPATGKAVRGEKVAGPLTDVQWSRDGTRVAASHRDAVLLFSPVTGATLATVPTGQAAGTVALAPNGASVAVGEEDGTVAVFSTGFSTDTKTAPGGTDTKTAPGGKAALWQAPGRTAQVQAFALSPDGSQAVSAHADGTLALWDLRAGRLIRAVRLPDFRLVTLAWSPDGRTLATSQTRQRLTATMMDAGVPPADLRLWDMPALTVRKVIPGTDPRYAWSALAFSPDGSLLAGLHDAGGMHLRGSPDDSAPAVLWDPRTGAEKQSLDGSFASPQAIAFAPTGGLLALSDRNTFTVYDPPAFAPRPNVAPNAGGFTALAFSRDGRTLITGNENGRVRFWPLEGTDQERRQGRYGQDPKTGLPSGDARIAGLSVSPDGATVASGGEDKTVRLWTVATAALAGVLGGQDARITALAYTPGGLLVTGNADGTLQVWDPKAGTLRATLALLPPTTPPAAPPVSTPGTPITNADGTAPPPPVPSDANWLAWTPGGFYQASPGAGPFADWVQEGQTLSAEVRRSRWNRPAQVTAALTATPR